MDLIVDLFHGEGTQGWGSGFIFHYAFFIAQRLISDQRPMTNDKIISLSLYY